MSIDDFQGWLSRRVGFMGGEIFCFFFKGDERDASIDEVNRNVFLVGGAGDVVWQVRRDDSIRPSDWWSILHAHARMRGKKGAEEPFMYFVLEYPDGSTNIDPKTGSPPDSAQWEPGCKILLMGSAYQKYVLDPETGMATNVTEGNPRPW